MNHFVQKYGREFNRPRTLSPEAMAAFRSYSWPGNVRELENVVQTTMLLAAGDVVGEWDLPPALTRQRPAIGQESQRRTLKVRLWDFERQSIAEAYARNHANITRTAHDLGLERNCLKYKLKKFGIAGQGPNGS